MKKFIFFILLSFCVQAVFAEELQKPAESVPVTVAQSVNYENCTKIFSINKEKLFYLTLGAINANRFSIDEIQSARGYVMFTANKCKYLASVSEVDNLNSIIKISPCNNLYYFAPGIITNIFKYIELNKNTDLK